MATGIPTYEQFRRSLAGTPMVGEAKGIYNAAIGSGINPAFVAGLASAESSYGTKGYARGTYNPYGLGVHLGWTFKNYSEATRRLGKTLNSLGYPGLYRDRGLAGIISRYTPASDGNDEGAHFKNIMSGGRRTGGNPGQVYVRGGVVPSTSGAEPSVGSPPPSMGVTRPMAGQGGGAGSATLLKQLVEQYVLSKAGTLTPEVARKTTLQMARAAGSAFGKSMMPQASMPGIAEPAPDYGGGGSIDERSPSPTQSTSTPILRIPGQPRLRASGGPGGGTHSFKERGYSWFDDMAYDLFAGSGTPITTPLAGRVKNISGQPGGDARFAGYGVTVDYGGGRQAFFKHLGALGPKIKIGATIPRGTLIGGLDKATAGGPHLHLGATNRGFLEQILSYYK
jgi:hypothetical protein